MYYSTSLFSHAILVSKKSYDYPLKSINSALFKSLGLMGKSVSDKKKLLQFLVGKRQLSVVIR